MSSAKPDFRSLANSSGGTGRLKVISLGLVAFMSLEECQFIFGFHAFRDHPQVQGATHTDDRRHDGGVVRSRSDLANEGLVDLQGIDRKLSKITEAGIAGTEIVDGDLYAHRF